MKSGSKTNNPAVEAFNKHYSTIVNTLCESMTKQIITGPEEDGLTLSMIAQISQWQAGLSPSRMPQEALEWFINSHFIEDVSHTWTKLANDVFSAMGFTQKN